MPPRRALRGALVDPGAPVVALTGAPGSGTEVMAFRALQSSGLDPSSDITKQALGVNESADALKDGKIDAFFWTSGLPAGSILDSNTSLHTYNAL